MISLGLFRLWNGCNVDADIVRQIDIETDIDVEIDIDIV